MAKKCAFCNQKLGFMSQYTNLKDGYLCGNCRDKYNIFQYANERNMVEWLATITVNQCKTIVNDPKKLDQAKIDHGYTKHFYESINQAKAREKENIQKGKIQDAKQAKAEQKNEQTKSEYDKLLADFKANASNSFSHYIFSDKKQQILVKKGMLRDPRVINYSDIVSYRVNQQGHNQKKHHGITRAVVGGVLAGGVGAIVGATTGHKQTDYIDHLGLVVTLKDGSNFELIFIRKIDQCKSNSFAARECIKQLNSYASWLDSIITKNQNEPAQNKAKTDPADEILKYKKLADQNIISQKEFEAKKKQLLNL